MKSFERRELILDLIGKNSVETQDDLLVLLKDAGVETTQATVSRDVKKLNLVKVQDPSGKYYYSVSKSGSADDAVNNTAFIRSAVLSIDYALNNVVVKCSLFYWRDFKKRMVSCNSCAKSTQTQYGCIYIIVGFFTSYECFVI